MLLDCLGLMWLFCLHELFGLVSCLIWCLLCVCFVLWGFIFGASEFGFMGMGLPYLKFVQGYVHTWFVEFVGVGFWFRGCLYLSFGFRLPSGVSGVWVVLFATDFELFTWGFTILDLGTCGFDCCIFWLFVMNLVGMFSNLWVACCVLGNFVCGGFCILGYFLHLVPLFCFRLLCFGWLRWWVGVRFACFWFWVRQWLVNVLGCLLVCWWLMIVFGVCFRCGMFCWVSVYGLLLMGAVW